MPNNHILLNIALNQDKVSALTVNGVPAIQTQKLATQVLINNNQTVILGGIIERSDSLQRSGLPILNHLPVLGALFSHHKHLKEKRELLIMITPKSLS